MRRYSTHIMNPGPLTTGGCAAASARAVARASNRPIVIPVGRLNADNTCCSSNQLYSLYHSILQPVFPA